MKKQTRRQFFGKLSLMKEGQTKTISSLNHTAFFLKKWIFEIFFDKRVFDTFLNKDQMYEIKPNFSSDHIPK